MKHFTALFVLLVIGLFCNETQAQTRQDVKDFSGWMYKAQKPKKTYKAAQKNASVVEYAFSNLFLFYKQYISSQDRNACTFTPSCSEYALQSIKKEGLILGMMSGFDRISRCNNLSREKYDIEPHTHLLYDPVP
jgi:putative component of membrane protein insertase Oxa1/YidC/SpoIIIJ protein YidD